MTKKDFSDRPDARPFELQIGITFDDGDVMDFTRTLHLAIPDDYAKALDYFLWDEGINLRRVTDMTARFIRGDQAKQDQETVGAGSR